MKRMVSLILTLIVLLSVMNMAGMVYAEDTETIISGDYEYSVNEDGTITITDYLGKDFDVRIPEIIDGRTVTIIGMSAFSPNQRQSLNSFSYKDCIISIYIPKTIVEIQCFVDSYKSNFYRLPLLRKIVVADDNEYYSSKKGVLFNKDKTELICYPSSRLGDYYIIPKTVEVIGINAFSGSKYLTNVKIGKKVKSIERAAFIDCYYLTKLYVPPTVTDIDYAAVGCVMVPHSVLEYDDPHSREFDFPYFSRLIQPMKGFVGYGKKGSDFEKYCNTRKRCIGQKGRKDLNIDSVTFKYPKFRKPKLKIIKTNNNNSFRYEVSYYKFEGLQYEFVVYKGKKKIIHYKMEPVTYLDYYHNGMYSDYPTDNSNKRFKPGNYTVKIRALIPISGYTFKTPWAKKTVKF